MAALEVPQRQIAAACGLSEGRISQVLADPECQALVTATAASRFDRFQTLNEAWDLVEEQAVGHVMLALEAKPDAEFALKVAAMANKAQRRGTFHNRPIEGGHGERAVINLTQNFVARMTENEHSVTLSRPEKPILPQKQEDIMSPAEVQEMLESPESKAKRDISELFRGVGVVPEPVPA